MIGIYKIIINNKLYIGSSLDIKNRIKQHKSDLKNNRHANPKLQNAYNKYHEFKYEILEKFDFIDIKDLRIREKYWCDLIGDYNINDPITNYVVKPIYQFDLNGNLIKKYDSARQAAHELNISWSNIVHAAQLNEHNTRTAGGYFWRYTKTITIPKDKRHTEIHVYDIYGNYISSYNSIIECASTLFPDISYNTDKINNVCNGLIAQYHGYRFSKEKVNKLDNSKLLKFKHNFPIMQISEDKSKCIKIWLKASDAAKEFNCLSYCITQAIQKDKVFKGYRWIRLGTKLSEMLETPLIKDNQQLVNNKLNA